MGLWNRYKTVRKAEKDKKSAVRDESIMDELDDFESDAGDALEAEILRELEEEKAGKRRK